MTRPMRGDFLTVGVVALISCLFDASRTSAQIHVGRDDHGALVLSDRPDSSLAQTARVAADRRIQTARPVTAAGSTDRFDHLIKLHATPLGVRPDLVRAVVQAESGFDLTARSSAGAMGLMQLMPATARELGVDDPFDPDQNLRGGITYLKQLLRRYGGDEELALAAYNAGPGAVGRFGNRVPPFPETRRYLASVRHRRAPGQSARTPAGGSTRARRSSTDDGFRCIPIHPEHQTTSKSPQSSSVARNELSNGPTGCVARRGVLIQNAVGGSACVQRRKGHGQR